MTFPNRAFPSALGEASDSFVEFVTDRPVARAPAPMAMMKAAAVLVQEEQLGDLKLYRVPDRTSVTSRQLKQVRLLDPGSDTRRAFIRCERAGRCRAGIRSAACIPAHAQRQTFITWAYRSLRDR